MENNPIQNPGDNQGANTPNNQVNYFGQTASNQPPVTQTQANSQSLNNPEIQIPEDLKGVKIFGLNNQTVNKQSNPLVAIAISVIFTILVAAIIYLISGKTEIASNSNNLVPTLILLLFPIVGSSIGLNMFLNERKRKEQCTQSTTGQCIEVNERFVSGTDNHNRIMYTPTYTYLANGQNFTIVSEDSYNRLMKPIVGSSKQIMFNPSDPGDAFIPKSVVQIIMMAAICGSMIICGFFALFLFINK